METKKTLILLKDAEYFALWQIVWRRFRSNRPAFYSLFVLSGIALLALIGPFFSPYAYDQIHLEFHDLAPSYSFWFGTDELGRDLFTRVCWGARISLFIGITAAFIDMILGVFWGSAAVLAGGKIEECMMRFCDILQSIPYLLLVILLTVIRGSGLYTILIALTCTGWINMARIVRGQMLQIQSLDYVAAARLFGASQTHILFKHLIPNSSGPIISTVTLTIPAAIFTEAFLSFLGLGVQAPAASWGVMISDSVGAMRYFPWRLLFPSAFMTITILCFNLIGNALIDAIDPRVYK